MGNCRKSPIIDLALEESSSSFLSACLPSCLSCLFTSLMQHTHTRTHVLTVRLTYTALPDSTKCRGWTPFQTMLSAIFDSLATLVQRSGWNISLCPSRGHILNYWRRREVVNPWKPGACRSSPTKGASAGQRTVFIISITYLPELDSHVPRQRGARLSSASSSVAG